MRGIKTALRDLSESVTRLRNHLREVEIQAETQMLSQQAVVADNAAGFDPLELDRFTRFQEATRMLAESVDDVAAVQHSLRLNLEHTDTALAAQARLNRSLSQRLLHARMVPFDSIAERLHRVVRQAARDTGKSVNLDIRAGHIEMDRSVLEKIAGSIEHLLRNGVAHGIEDETARYRAGKPMPGRLSIALSQTGNDVCIDIEDDGAGLDFERIRRRGIESGLLAQDAPAEPAMLIPLLFHAGFSTAAEVTQLSGRGVGLGVVKTDINALGGRIDVTSEAGKGTRFRLTLPLTLALTQAALVQAGGRRYAIPATMLEQAIRQTPEAMDAIRQAGRLEVQGAFYPWHYLSHLLDDRAASPAPNGWLLQIKSGTDCLALAVDGFDEPREIVVKPLGPQLSRVPGLLGATVMADGEIVLLFNPIALLMRTAAWQAAALSPVSKPAAIETQPVVMVVDDSLTVRKITSRLLSRHGYRVLTARDGVDALEQLRTEMPAVLLVDIEMPRMDGFALTRAVRTDARLAHLPIIVITSRIAEKHRQHAFEAGVNHYLGKPYNEDELLRLIADFTAQEKS
jgi:chemosensory pili system protein ChpA (sensor histidine kinase/response regulator)